MSFTAFSKESMPPKADPITTPTLAGFTEFSTQKWNFNNRRQQKDFVKSNHFQANLSLHPSELNEMQQQRNDKINHFALSSSCSSNTALDQNH